MRGMGLGEGPKVHLGGIRIPFSGETDIVPFSDMMVTGQGKGEKIQLTQKGKLTHSRDQQTKRTSSFCFLPDHRSHDEDLAGLQLTV